MILLAQSVFVIPVSQIENDRVFSIAGIMSKNHRSRIGVDSIEKIKSIYDNLEDTALKKMVPSEESDLIMVIDDESELEAEPCDNID